MFSKIQFALLFVAIIAAVQGFAPVSQPKLGSSTELGAFSFFKKDEGSSTKGVAKKAAPAKKAPVKKVTVKNVSKNDFFAKPPTKKAPKLTIYERQCHIN